MIALLLETELDDCFGKDLLLLFFWNYEFEYLIGCCCLLFITYEGFVYVFDIDVGFSITEQAGFMFGLVLVPFAAAFW